MPDMSEYGTAESPALVPDSLICYRHFILDPAKLRVTPMNASSSEIYAAPGTFVADCLNAKQYQRPVEEFLTAYAGFSCACSSCREHREKYSEDRKKYYDGEDNLIHKSPSVECTCGFYAHYDPRTDFYEHTVWGPHSYMYYVPNNMGVVRAVVEMTGTTVAGTKGVRAQKMQVKALCIDWAKYQGRQVEVTAKPRDFLQRWEAANSNRLYCYEPAKEIRYEPPEPVFRDFMERKTSETAAFYGAAYFTSPHEMYAAFPKPDLSALGIEEEPHTPPPVPFDDSVFVVPGPTPSQYWVQYLTNSLPPAPSPGGWVGFSGISSSSFTFSGIFDDEAAVWADDKKAEPEVELTAFERAMLAKKSRPAPPGTGIDRRKKKL